MRKYLASLVLAMALLSRTSGAFADTASIWVRADGSNFMPRVVDALRERGRRVPDDVAIVGFDNWEIVAAATRPPLTTVDMNLTTLGREAGLALLSVIDGETVEPGVRKLPCRLVVRQSCGGPSG